MNSVGYVEDVGVLVGGYNTVMARFRSAENIFDAFLARDLFSICSNSHNVPL